MRPAFFLDRDGTINIDRVYINDPRLIELIPGSGQAIARAQKAGYAIVVVTNQSGVGRGLIEPKALPKIHDRLDELLRAEGASIDSYKICLHKPQDDCACRKPEPKLVLEAAEELGLDVSRSIFVGDKLTDVATGRRAGCKYSILLRSGKGAQEEVLLNLGKDVAEEEKPNFVAEDLAAAVDWVLGKDKLVG